MGLFKRNKNNNKEQQKVLYSNRRESLRAEHLINDSVEQWEDVKNTHNNKVEKMLYEKEVEQRRKDALVEKKKIFIEEMIKKEEAEAAGFEKRSEIENKINNKKRWELRKRDIAFRNRSIFG